MIDSTTVELVGMEILLPREFEHTVILPMTNGDAAVDGSFFFFPLDDWSKLNSTQRNFEFEKDKEEYFSPR
jgi:hypothetical protein